MSRIAALRALEDDIRGRSLDVRVKRQKVEAVKLECTELIRVVACKLQAADDLAYALDQDERRLQFDSQLVLAERQRAEAVRDDLQQTAALERLARLAARLPKDVVALVAAHHRRAHAAHCAEVARAAAMRIDVGHRAGGTLTCFVRVSACDLYDAEKPRLTLAMRTWPPSRPAPCLVYDVPLRADGAIDTDVDDDAPLVNRLPRWTGSRCDVHVKRSVGKEVHVADHRRVSLSAVLERETFAFAEQLLALKIM